MIVKVQVCNKQIRISVGDGKQTIKWLAAVVQARIQHFGLLRTAFQEKNHLVTEIKNTVGELLDPKDSIYEHATGDILAVIATVVNSYPLDEWENPEMGDWMKSAFVRSSAGVSWANEIEAWRTSLERVKASNAEAGSHEGNIIVQRTQPQASNLIQIGFDFTESDINAAFDLDWGVMHWEWLSPSEHRKNQLGDVMKTHYALICNLFAHYCGKGQGEL